MKKINYLAVLIAVFAVSVNAQEMLTGGNMEDAGAWQISNLNGEVAAEDVIVDFNYTDDFPIEGDGVCMHVSTSTTGPMVNHAIYQEVTLKRGVEYTTNLAFKNTIDFMNFWFEIWVGGAEPVDGGDYNADIGSVLLGGFKYSGWEGGCTDLIDGSLEVDNCLPDTDRTLMIEGEGDTTVFYVIKFGMGWEDITSDFMVDEVSLMGPATPVEEIASDQMKSFVYPSPATSQINLSNIQAEEVKIYSISGKEIYTTRDVKEEMQIDISEFSQGLYIIKAGKQVSKFIKQ